MSKSGNEIHRVVHNPIPDEWRGKGNVDVVQNIYDTSYLPDDAEPGTRLYLAGNDLQRCVRIHLEEVAIRQPVISGRVEVYLSLSHTITWHQTGDRVERPNNEEFEEIVALVLQKTGVSVLLSD